jgi:L-alanine-DL-glutamate epimerase-like enolase superfamily enzyme
MCAENAVAPVIGSQGDSDFGMLAGAHFYCAHRATSAWPGELSFFLDMQNGLLAEAPQIRDGMLELSDRPGLGIVIDEDRLKHIRLDH